MLRRGVWGTESVTDQKPAIVTALDTPPNRLDAEEQDFVAIVREHGWHMMNVFDDEGGLPSFTYTTGFWRNAGFPELIVFSLKSEIAGDILWDIWREIEAGSPPPIGVRTAAVLGRQDVYLIPVGRQHYAEHLGWGRWFYGGDELPCIQLVWPAREGLFPWEPGFGTEFRDSQLDLSADG